MTDSRALILKCALPLVPFDGWSDYTLLQASKRASISEAELKRVFPKGVADCLDYFFEQEDDALAASLPAETLAAKRVPDRIETLIMTKLERFIAHREAIRRAVSHRALPWNAASAIQSLYRSVDIMWKLAGDASTDFNFYSKRMTLATLYSSTLIYWLNDTSDNMENTREFLKRRLSDIAAFGKKKKAVMSKFKMA